MELAMLDWIQRTLACPFLDAVMPALTRLGDAGLVWIVLGVVLAAIPKTRLYGVAVLAALLIDLIFCNGILKPLIDRARPFAGREEVLRGLVDPPGDASFPSGHTAAGFSAAGALLFSRAPKRISIPATALAAVIAFSRLYLYVHFPTDVAAGLVFGLLFGAAGAFLVTRAARAIARRKHE